MKKGGYILLLAVGLASCEMGQAQTMGLPFKIKYVSDKNPFYPTYGSDILDKVTSNHPAGGGFTSSVTASASQSTITNTAIPQVQTFYMSFDSATVDPSLTYTYSATPSGGTSSPATASRVIDVKLAPKGAYYVLVGSRSTIYYLVGVPRPAVSLTSTAGLYCPSDTVKLSAYIWGGGIGVNLHWYFYVGNPSDTATVSTSLGTLAGGGLNFTANSVPALANVVNSITTTTPVTFYCIGDGGDAQSDRSTTVTVNFSPAGPSVSSVTTTDACPNSTGTTGGGSIVLNNITGGGSYRYILRDGLNSTDLCDPNTGTCNLVEASSSFSSSSGGSYTINNVPAGNYTLWVANSGSSVGACAQTFNITINSIPNITLSDSTHTNVSCAGGNNGSITVHTSGGLAGTASYQLLREPGDISVATQTTGVFTGLTGGLYNLKVLDGCHSDPSSPAWAHTFIVTQPTQVTGSFTETDATCNNPGNGQMIATVSQGSGTYNYYLYLSGSLVSSLMGSSNTTWQVDDLAPGSYSLQVLDAAAASCSGYTTTVTIGGPPALSMTLQSETDPSCNGAVTGILTLSGAGGTGTYKYSITNTDVNQTAFNSTGTFASLPAGHYTAVLQSSLSGCSDTYTYPTTIVISQPVAISIGLSPTDVQCYGQQNGSIVASLSGGTGTLTPTWQQQNAGVWSAASGSVSASGSNTTLSGLLPGTYRLSVTDANSCSTTSTPVTIAQPAALSIPSVTTTDIVCYGSNGTITPQATGGNGGNTFAYSANGGSSYINFTPGAFFPAGSYLIQVTDSKGCQASYSQAQVITAPASALTFTDALSNYNGYNVSCYGATTGSVTVSATGGNGSTYNGYTYSIDGGSYQSSPVLSTLPAGSHTIRVEDGRGCIVSQTETLTQPISALSLSLQSEQDNNCANGQAGVLSISANGGDAPYQFSIDGGASYQNNGTFNNLATGSYTITAMDQNGCRLAGDYSIASLNPAFSIKHSIQPVSCNDGSNGAITLAVSGGAGSYTYQWSELANGGSTAVAGSGPLLSGVTAGIYRALITDTKGCTSADTATVSQPTALNASVQVQPVCSNNANGTINILASGGTPPYQYASASSGAYQTNDTLKGLAAGNYTVWVMDNNGCSWSKPATITTSALTPSVSFLVSTQQNALDTLQVEDVSDPKPDSVVWSFAPQTIVLGSNTDGPLIRYAQAGTYPVTMQAFYSGCDFPMTQNIVIQPYDPNSTSAPVLAGLSFDSVLLAPNPNNGVFNLYVQLYKAQRMTMTITSLSGQQVFAKQWNGQQLISEQVPLPSSVVSGAYIAELVTETEVRDYNIIVTK